MTNVDFFKAFADSKSYYFEHGREDFANLYDAEDGIEGVKMFHFTDTITPFINPSGKVESVTYVGRILAGRLSGFDELIKDVTGKYEKYVKDLIDDGGIIEEIGEYNYCNGAYQLTFSNIREIYNVFDVNIDGLWITYTLTIRND